jgi:hypothetical protein
MPLALADKQIVLGLSIGSGSLQRGRRALPRTGCPSADQSRFVTDETVDVVKGYDRARHGILSMMREQAAGTLTGSCRRTRRRARRDTSATDAVTAFC